MTVYELNFFFHRNNGFLVVETFFLGFYSSFDRAQQAIQYYISQPGFCDCPEAFTVRQRDVKGSVEQSQFFETMVYFHTDDYEYEHSVELGLFGDESSAHEALSVFVQENKHLFNIPDLPAEKIVNRCILDKRTWAEGFTSE